MRIHVKNIIIMKKVEVEGSISRFDRIVIPINQIMSKAELKQLQKDKAIEFGVTQNMVGGNIDEIE